MTKRTLFHFSFDVCVLLACVLTGIVAACSGSEIYPEHHPTDTEASRLVSSLNEYSSEFIAQHMTPSRKDWGWSKFKEAIKADHQGYSNGSWVGSISESRKNGKNFKKPRIIQVMVWFTLRDSAFLSISSYSLRHR